MQTSTLALAGLAATAAAETIRGVLVFSRHGDRTSKHFRNQTLTPLGAKQVYQVAQDYRARYLSSDSAHQIRGISEFEFVPAQVYASAPDESILLNTATAFLQGLYPPLGDIDAAAFSTMDELANGTSVSSPLTGYQYVTLHGVNDDSPESVWIKGDDNCPVLTTASASFQASAEYNALLSSTRDFYQSLYPFVSEIYPSASDLSYAKAYDIFDVVNVATIHDASSPARNMSASQLFQLRTLADSAEFAANYNATQPDRSIHAATFAGSVLSHLNQTVSSQGHTPKFTLLVGSYDTFLSFFGLANLTAASSDFYGLPAYASTMAFELFTPTTTTTTDNSSEQEENFDMADLHVRYLFRNGTEASLQAFPLFGTGRTELPWAEFVDVMQARAISSAGEWCGRCQSTAVFCAAYATSTTNTGDNDNDGVAVAGDNKGEETVSRGAWVAVLVVMAVAVAGNMVWAAMWLVRNRRVREERMAAASAAVGKAGSVRSVGRESV
ncbi:phosphoglycerate mutase-like protein [Parathielavia appendiculata]|uniref:Phosphoglycerate mutase-like protein n=1 Tax=Parathielavia appendiculata TaxID=2587402 RepID=A0AAN6TX48_9PEZI|nr:phosphoglycerate mutase-like protein [Parathielavia appendiculata]